MQFYCRREICKNPHENVEKNFPTIDIVFKKGLIIMFLRVFHSFPQNARVEK